MCCSCWPVMAVRVGRRDKLRVPGAEPRFRKEVGYVTGLKGGSMEESKYCCRPFIKACHCVFKIWSGEETTIDNIRLIRQLYSFTSTVSSGFAN